MLSVIVLAAAAASPGISLVTCAAEQPFHVILLNDNLFSIYQLFSCYNFVIVGSFYCIVSL